MLGKGIMLESQNLLFRSLLVSVVKIWKLVWKCVLYLQEHFLIEVGVEKRPIYLRKLLNNTKFGIG